MLQTSALFFCRLDKLGDPFEGSLPRPNFDLKSVRIEDSVRNMEGLTEVQRATAVIDRMTWTANLTRAVRRCSAVNCWHIGHHESTAMWDIYVKAGAGVAVRSTFDRLRLSLDDTSHVVRLGKVRYIDYDADSLPDGNLFWCLTAKRKSFEHERELRAVVSDMVRATHGGPESRSTAFDAGLTVAVDLKQLVESVYVSPTAPKWLDDVVRGVTDRYGFDWDVRQSSLLDEALF